MDKYRLIEKGFIPLSKYWSMRLGFLDIINDTEYFISQIQDREDIGDDLKTMIRVSEDWQNKEEINVGEAGALFRMLQFASWKYDLKKKFIKRKTLIERKVCDNPEIVNWKLEKLLELDNNTPQWASAAILLGNKEEFPYDYFLNLSKEAREHYETCRREERLCEVRYDDTILRQAEAFVDLLKTGRIYFIPEQQDDYCFSRAFDLIDKDEGKKRWPELISQESNRIEEMEKQLENLGNYRIIDSRDHRVVQSIAMLGRLTGKHPKFAFPDCVAKSWPQFWEFLEEANQ